MIFPLSNGDVLILPETLLQTKYEEIMLAFVKIEDAYKGKEAGVDLHSLVKEKNRLLISAMVQEWKKSDGTNVPVESGYDRLTRPDYLKLKEYFDVFVFGKVPKEQEPEKKA